MASIRRLQKTSARSSPQKELVEAPIKASLPRRAALPEPPPDSLAHAFLSAARVLVQVFDGHSLSATLAADRNKTPAVQDLVYGALRRYGWGDFVLRQLLERPLAFTEAPFVRGLLLAALYRLETRLEAGEGAHTVVDQAVAAAATVSRGAYKGLVNALLRAYLRQREAISAAAAQEDEATCWHPDWWLRRLRQAYPETWPALVAAGNRMPPFSLRVNRRRTSGAVYLERLAEAGIDARAAGESGVMLTRPCPVERLPGFTEGEVSVQDLGAQRAAVLLDVQESSREVPLRVLDACAAPGGKAAHLLEIAEVDLLALELQPQRIRSIEENFARLKLAAAIKAADCRAVGQWWDGVPFTRILADVPCSASGVVRRHPDSKWLRRDSDIAQYAHTQAEILDALWPVLARGGKLLYATCSVFPEENQLQVADFLARHPDACVCHEEQLLPGQEHDGFFYALLQKNL